MATISSDYKSSLIVGAAPIGQKSRFRIITKMTGVKHNLIAYYLGQRTVIAKSSTATLINWTAELETCAALMPDTNEAKFNFILSTYYDSELVGSESIYVTFKLPASFAPTLSPGWASLSPHNTGLAAPFNSYIAGHSGVKAAFDSTKIDCSALCGATIARYSMELGGVSYEAPYQSAIIRGETAVTCTVYDSRGQSSSETFTIAPESWAEPTLSLISVFRADAAGNADEDGNYCAVSAALNFSPVAGENSGSLSCAYRPKDGTWGAENAMESGKVKIIGPVSPDVSCEIRISGADELGGSVTVLRSLPTRSWAMKFREDGRGVAFGKAPESELKIELHEDWGISRGAEQVYFSPAVLSLSLPASGWTGTGQKITVTGLKATDVIILDAVGSSAAELEAWAQVLRAVPENGALQFYCAETPEADINLKALVLRK